MHHYSKHSSINGLSHNIYPTHHSLNLRFLTLFMCNTLLCTDVTVQPHE